MNRSTPWHKKEKKTNHRHFRTTNNEEKYINELMRDLDCTFTELAMKGIKELKEKNLTKGE